MTLRRLSRDQIDKKIQAILYAEDRGTTHPYNALPSNRSRINAGVRQQRDIRARLRQRQSRQQSRSASRGKRSSSSSRSSSRGRNTSRTRIGGKCKCGTRKKR